MPQITFRRTGEDEARIYEDGRIVGELFRDEDYNRPGGILYTIHLAEDGRGPVRVRERSSIRKTVIHLLDTLPYR